MEVRITETSPFLKSLHQGSMFSETVVSLNNNQSQEEL
jgi:hypothetical protein